MSDDAEQVEAYTVHSMRLEEVTGEPTLRALLLNTGMEHVPQQWFLVTAQSLEQMAAQFLAWAAEFPRADEEGRD